MDIQGQWTLEWGTNAGIKEAGVINFESGIISGGDSENNYSGNYKTLSADSIKGTIEVTSKKAGALTIFGRDSNYKVNFTGDFGIAVANQNRPALMVIDSHLGDGPPNLIRLICEK